MAREIASSSLAPVWIDGADVAEDDEDEPSLDQREPKSAVLATALDEPAAPPASGAIEPPPSDAPPPQESLDEELAVLSRRTRRSRRWAVLAAVATASLAAAALFAVSYRRQPILIGGAPPRAVRVADVAAASVPLPPARVVPRDPPRSELAKPDAEISESAPAGSASAGVGVDLSAAVRAAVSGGAVDDPNSSTVIIRSSPPGAMLFRDDKQIGNGRVEIKIRRGDRAKLLALLNEHEPTRLTIDGSRPEIVIVLPRNGRDRPSGAPAAAAVPNPRPVEASSTPAATAATPSVAPPPATAALPDPVPTAPPAKAPTGAIDPFAEMHPL
ncbi:MAG: hypothetical protein JW751_27070 [Polyangiaceae bacterium]|nr:hypothetical protein [Polyangiaceae bacterium]